MHAAAPGRKIQTGRDWEKTSRQEWQIMLVEIERLTEIAAVLVGCVLVASSSYSYVDCGEQDVTQNAANKMTRERLRWWWLSRTQRRQMTQYCHVLSTNPSYAKTHARVTSRNSFPHQFVKAKTQRSQRRSECLSPLMFVTDQTWDHYDARCQCSLQVLLCFGCFCGRASNGILPGSTIVDNFWICCLAGLPLRFLLDLCRLMDSPALLEEEEERWQRSNGKHLRMAGGLVSGADNRQGQW